MRVLYPGSFDPVTRGHLDLVRRGLAIFGELTVAVAHNSGKSAVFTLDERLQLLRASLDECLPKVAARIQVVALDGLVVDYCRAHDFSVLLRGLRNGTDLDYEYQMANTNAVLASSVETVFLLSAAAHSFVATSLIKQIAKGGGDVSTFVPRAVVGPLQARLRAVSD